MRLLITTQVVDRTDPFLGFFHGWIAELAKRFERIEVICLKEGEHELPANVRVHSLGKERGASSRIAYSVRFLKLVWKLRGSYDTVFVHMNQEYILIAGWLWLILSKRIYLWRNHYAGGLLTDVAASFALKVFCTSRYSYTATYKKTTIMPVGVDAELFVPSAVTRTPRSILFFARFAPAKKPDVLLEALGILSKEGVPFEASFYGSSLPQDEAYRASTVERAKVLGLGDRTAFYPGVPHAEAPAVFRRHEIFVNLSSSGTYDKMMFEAAASGCVVIAASKDFAAIVGEQYRVAEDAKAVADKLRDILALPQGERAAMAAGLREVVLKGHSLGTLINRLAEALVS
jgi:glycosyltransferase involved in cell wall biosynthesis